MSGTLVRVWNGFQDEVASGFVEWDGGGFSLPTSNPLADRLFKSAHLGNLQLTVYSTEELYWTVHRVDVDGDGAHVHCEPFIDTLRNSLVSDDYLVWAWLEAEKFWVAS